MVAAQAMTIKKGNHVGDDAAENHIGPAQVVVALGDAVFDNLRLQIEPASRPVLSMPTCISQNQAAPFCQRGSKSFLLLFFKKEALALTHPRNPKATT